MYIYIYTHTHTHRVKSVKGAVVVDELLARVYVLARARVSIYITRLKTTERCLRNAHFHITLVVNLAISVPVLKTKDRTTREMF